MKASMGDPPRQSKVFNLKSKLCLALLWIGLFLPGCKLLTEQCLEPTQFSCDPWSVDGGSCPLVQKAAISKEIRANVTATLQAVQEHEKAKKEVTDVLRALSRDVELIVVDNLESEMTATTYSMLGRGTIIVTAAASLFLTAPVAVAGVGYVIGYAIVGGSKTYMLSVKSKHKKRVAEIHAELQKQLEKYTDSQFKVFDTLDVRMALLTEGQDVKKNMNRIRNIVQEIEDTSEGLCFIELFLFLEKAKAKYISIPQDQKENLNTNDFLLKAKELMSNAGKADNNARTQQQLVGAVGVSKVGTGTGVGTVYNAVLSSAFFHGLNLIVNGVFLVNDWNKFMELREMRGEEWSTNKIFKERPKLFEKEKELRDLIEDIRDEIMKSY